MIRQATLNDIKILHYIARLTVQAMHESGLDQWSDVYPGEKDFENDVHLNQGYVYISDNTVVGYFALIKHDPYYDGFPLKYKRGLAVHRLLVSPKYQGMGLSHEMFKGIYDLARNQKAEAIWIDTHPANTKMQRLLKTHQFKEIGFIDKIYRILYERPTFFNKPSKILIFGNSGTGKTTLNHQLSKKLNIPSLHLDTMYWQKNWQSLPRDLFYEKLKNYLDSHTNFVMDGNYLNADILDLRLNHADTLIFLDYDTNVALNGIKHREAIYGGTVRSEMAEGCIEKVDQEFLSYVLSFNETRRPQLLKILSDHYLKKIVLRFENRKSVELFLETL